VVLRSLRRLSVVVLIGLVIGPGRADDPPMKAGRRPDSDRKTEDRKVDKTDKADERKADLKESVSETRHEITVNGRKLRYQALAGNLLLREEDGKPTASVFFVAYSLLPGDGEPQTPALARPVTFAFNGGPGSSSVWLHLGAFGPKRVALADTGEALPPPYKLVDNEFTLLDLTDLVFIDPVSTGFSRAAPGVDPKRFHGVQEDITAVGEFIRLYTTRYGRWGSPKYLAGESYGTTRAGGLSGYLQDRDGLNLNGIILVSSILNFETARFDDGNDLPYPLFLPTYTATAWYHKKLPPDLQNGDLQQALAEAERFARGEYALALMQGDRLPDVRRQEVVRKLAWLTGLSEEYVREANLRIEIQRFVKQLLRDRRRTVGRYDSRLLGTDLDAAGERAEYDPSYAAVQGAYTATLNQFLRSDLKVVNDIPYEILTGRVQPWDYGTARNRYLNVAPTLRSAMTKNRDLRLFVACGYYDLATPFAAADYTLDHLGLDSSLRGNVTTAYYEAGHMMYIHRPSLEKLRRDLAAFFRGERRSGEVGGGR
jgi:carboxypeptidase C (cathepsin A)